MRNAICLAFVLIGCASEPKAPSKYPEQKPGCDVQVFEEEPSYQTENIGTVRAICNESVSTADCERELKDQACKLGADTVWGAGTDTPNPTGKRTRSGRAAHRK